MIQVGDKVTHALTGEKMVVISVKHRPVIGLEYGEEQYCKFQQRNVKHRAVCEESNLIPGHTQLTILDQGA